jgi:hypothetical protein
MCMCMCVSLCVCVSVFVCMCGIMPTLHDTSLVGGPDKGGFLPSAKTKVRAHTRAGQRDRSSGALSCRANNFSKRAHTTPHAHLRDTALTSPIGTSSFALVCVNEWRLLLFHQSMISSRIRAASVEDCGPGGCQRGEPHVASPPLLPYFLSS